MSDKAPNNRPGQIARPILIGRADERTLLFCLAERKKKLICKFSGKELKLSKSYSEFQISKYYHEHQGTWIFDVYTFDGVKTASSTQQLLNHLIACVRTGQRCNQNSSNIYNGTSYKNS